MARKTKRDWMIAGTHLLIEVGIQGLTIDALCQYLGVTKGSFYHHFQSYEDFKISFLTYYEEEGTLEIIERLVDMPTPQAKLKGLIDIIVEVSTTYLTYPETVIRAWALQDEAVRVVQTRVDGRRLAYVTELCLAITEDADIAKKMAQMLYAILIGSEQMQPPIVGASLRSLFVEYLRLYEIDQ